VVDVTRQSNCRFTIYPEMRIELILNDRYVDLIEEGFDVGIRGGAGLVNDTSLVLHRICDIQRVVCASPAYLKQYGEPTSPEDLKQHHCVVYTLARSPHEWSFWQGHEAVSVHIDGFLKVNNSLAASQAAVAGLGLIFLPMFTVLDGLERGMLKTVLREWSTEPLTLYSIYPKHRQHSRKLQVFIDFMSEALASIAARL
jgi:DNA-binding transcriptional LysR family regulator